MIQDTPSIDDYLRLFGQYGEGVETLYMEPADDRYELLFERILRLLAKPSQFNLGLPEPFRRTAHRYLAGDAATLRQLEDRDTRHFMLCEVHDYVMLNGGLARRRQLAAGG
ncbi:hypothetical protein [Poseidonocella sp. HB161398]|uniref:hypothetical protein n=1 Tax=Poseidonocella sp. HB161398 TaxID=2320855 RepID=UPI001108F914|nr:hypothetical protein [Poseidonocella sp. HB161398]